VAAEFFATFLFALIGAAAPYKKAAWANGIALVVLIYVTANVSGARPAGGLVGAVGSVLRAWLRFESALDWWFERQGWVCYTAIKAR